MHGIVEWDAAMAGSRAGAGLSLGAAGLMFRCSR